jgi:hypothetical protein
MQSEWKRPSIGWRSIHDIGHPGVGHIVANVTMSRGCPPARVGHADCVCVAQVEAQED